MPRLQKYSSDGYSCIVIMTDGDVDIYKATPEFELKYLRNCDPSDETIIERITQECKRINIDYFFNR